MRTILFIALTTLAACSDQSGSDLDTDIDAPIGKADAASVPAGAYTNATPHYGELTSVTLNADHTFTRSAIQACTGGGTCAPLVQTGKFLLTHSSTRHYVHFYDHDGSSMDKYQWKLNASGSMKFNLEGDNSWFTMAKGATCESTGGNCVPLVPDSCEFGALGDATQYTCGGGLGVECCLPLQPDNSCNADSDCTGGLPQFCKLCSDNTTSCAHWSCIENACQIATCN